MKSKRLAASLLVLVGLGLLLALWHFLRFDEPVYAGKPVSAWFKEYAYFTNAPTRMMVYTASAKGRFLQFTDAGVTVLAAQVLTNRPIPRVNVWSAYGETPNPAWQALQALGSNAVPYLVQQLRYGTLDRTYERAVTNLPVFLQRKLPNPTEKRWYRIRALQAVAQLKDAGRGATPALLDLLRKPEPLLRSQVLATLRSIYADGQSISALLLQLGAERRFAEVLEIARETRWEGSEVAQLFGEILQSPDTALHRDAITLLEAGAERAAPALKAILAALQSPDGEVRYLAVRAVENIICHAPPGAQPRIATELQPLLADQNVMVRNVVRRALARIEGDALPWPSEIVAP